MNLDYKTKQELNALSKEVFGVSSRWQKLVKNGYSEVITEEVEELVPSDVLGEEPKTEKVRKPVLRADGAKLSTTKRYTVESVKELMLKLKTAREEYLARLKKMQEEAKAAQEKQDLAKKIHVEATGSSL